MRISRFLSALCLAAAPALAWSANAPAQLREFVNTVSSASGQFTQQTFGQRGADKPAQSGEFSFQRPGKFKWRVTKPYEQLILSDGQTLYQYDPDLAQVTERGVDQSIGASPAAILFGSGSLEESFNVSALPDKDGLQWLRATPRTADAGFKHVDIGFKQTMPSQLLLVDSFGQTTHIEFDRMVPNPTLPANEFRFVAPKGVDVVKMQ